MKKAFIYLFFLSVAHIFISCNNEEAIIIDLSKENTTPETEIFFQGQKLFYEGEGTRSSVARIKIMNPSGGLAWPKHTNDGWESARFSIRADGTIPDFYDKSSTLYFGRPAGKAGINSHNVGKLANLYNYPHYNDRDMDYYKTDQKTGNNIGLFRYIYDQQGLKTQPVILEAPSVVDILSDEVTDLTGKTDKASVENLAKVNALLEKGAEYLDSHVLWYVVKEVAGQYRWHVNGVIRDVETPEYVFDPVPDNVEVDVHQQEHKDWFEIKTSIHVRTDVQSVKVIIPLKEEDVLEKDDFDIRVYDVFYKDYVIKHNIKHDANGITIEITDIPADMIQEMKSTFGDGITVEVHSYCKKDVWEDLKNSRVQTGKPCNVEGHASSALRPGDIAQIYVEQYSK